MSDATRLLTADELEKFPDDDYKYELVEGRLVRMSPTGWEHVRIAMRFGFLLGRHVQARNLGEVVTEVGFTLCSNPDTVRAPDVAFVRQERLPIGRLRGFWTGAPDLAAEVLSPDDRPADIRAKIDEYLTYGVLGVVVLDPDEATATIHRRLSPPVTSRGDEDVDLDDIVMGFCCKPREIFE
jgi:Uma2 family endonuclease